MNKEKKRIGIFGGSFNPIHIGHIEMANLAILELNLDLLYIVPVGTPCHRCDREFASGKDRFNMVKLAFKDNSKIIPCDYEISSEEISYTYDTLLKIQNIHPNSLIFEIIGEDSAEYLHTWKNYEKMKKLCEFAYFKRKGYRSNNSELLEISSPLFNVSSTTIRENIKNNKPLGEFLISEVEEYIRNNKLYELLI
jgi:nicotinate-nucleotide adenylyltransferase